MNHYEILGVPKNATTQQIKAKYKKLVKQFHPDMSKDDKEDNSKYFNEITNAYKTLIDKEKRKEYDKELEKIENGEDDDEEIDNTEELTTNFFGQEFYDAFAQFDTIFSKPPFTPASQILNQPMANYGNHYVNDAPANNFMQSFPFHVFENMSKNFSNGTSFQTSFQPKNGKK